MTRIAVVGAGIVGASVAMRLAEAGARVWLLDAAQPGRGTTARSFAWVNANGKTPRDYFDLNVAGMAEHRRLGEESGGAPWFHPDGNLAWADTAEGAALLAARVDRLRAWGYRADWCPAGAAAEREPHLAFPDPNTLVARFPDEGWVDAPALTARCVARARAAGAEVRTAAPVTAIETSETTGGAVSAVRLRDGERLPVDAVVNAAGPGADCVAALVGRSLPLAPRRGLLGRLAVERPPLTGMVTGPRLNARPDGEGFVLVQNEALDAEIGDRARINPDDPLCRRLLAHAREAIPALAAAPLVEARVGVRPIPADERSCVGAVPDRPGYHEAVTHSGVTLGPLIGRLLAREILVGEVDPLLAPFRPDRFPSEPRPVAAPVASAPATAGSPLHGARRRRR